MRFVIYEGPGGVWFVLEDQKHRAILASRLFRNINWCRVGIRAIVDLMCETNMQKKTASDDFLFKHRFSEYVYVNADGCVRVALITGVGNVLANSRAYPTLHAYNEEIAWVCRKIRGAPLAMGGDKAPMQPVSQRLDDMRTGEAEASIVNS